MLGAFEAAGIWSAGEQRSVCKSLKQTRVASEKNCRLKGKNQTKKFEKMWGASGYHGRSVLGHKIRAWAATIIGNSKACMPKSIWKTCKNLTGQLKLPAGQLKNLKLSRLTEINVTCGPTESERKKLRYSREPTGMTYGSTEKPEKIQIAN